MEHQTTTTTTTTNNNNNKRHTIIFVKYIHREDILVERDMQGPDVAQKKLILLLGNDGHSREGKQIDGEPIHVVSISIFLFQTCNNPYNNGTAGI